MPATHQLQPATHQVGGQMDAGSPLAKVDASGRFYKPYQHGPRSDREVSFYQALDQGGSTLGPGGHCHSQWGPEGCLAPRREDIRALAECVPGFYGTATHGDAQFVVLEDLCHDYSQPCVLDVKIGYRTWYPWAPEAKQVKQRGKDATSTQSSVGFTIQGLQVYSHREGRTVKQDRQWGKTLTKDTIDLPFTMFADNGALTPADLFHGPGGALEALGRLVEVFEAQRSFVLFRASVLLAYDGAARSREEARLKVRLVDFAHTYCSDQASLDTNFLGGLRSLVAVMSDLGQ